MNKRMRFLDNGVNMYTRFHLEEREEGCVWFIDVEGEWEDEIMVGGSLEEVIKKGKDKGYWYEGIDFGEKCYYYEWELDNEISGWLGVSWE